MPNNRRGVPSIQAAQTDRNGRVTNYAYDGLGRLKQEQWVVGGSTVNTLAYTYDAGSQLTAASDNASAYAYTYNANGLVTSVDNQGTPNVPRVVLTSAYDSLNRRTQLSASVNGTADFQNKYAYDSLSRITQITQQSQTGGNAVASKRVDFAYNGVGQYTSVTRFADLAGTQLVATSSYGYDGAGRITSLAHAKGATSFNSYTWSYDALSRPTQQTSNDGTDTYTYDASSQVTGATHTSQANESLTYDANGNRTVSGYSTGTNNRLNSDGVYNDQYDAEGNRTRRTEIATGKYELYAWDNHNRLTSVASYTSAGVLTKQVAYTYDVFDRRIGRQVDADGNGTYDTTQRFVYDGDDLVLAYNAAGALTNRYLVGPNVDEILADENGSGTVTWCLADNLGSVRDLAQYTSGTNTTTVVNHVVYDAFGQIKSQTNTTWQPLFAYTGREWDADAGLYYYRARWYDARVGRFISEDPLGFAAGDVNLSRYVANSVTMFVDPSGLEETPVYQAPSTLVLSTGKTPFRTDNPFSIGGLDPNQQTTNVPPWPNAGAAAMTDHGFEQYTPLFSSPNGITGRLFLPMSASNPPDYSNADILDFLKLLMDADGRTLATNTGVQMTWNLTSEPSDNLELRVAGQVRQPLSGPTTANAAATFNVADAILVVGYLDSYLERKFTVQGQIGSTNGTFSTNLVDRHTAHVDLLLPGIEDPDEYERRMLRGQGASISGRFDFQKDGPNTALGFDSRATFWDRRGVDTQDPLYQFEMGVGIHSWNSPTLNRKSIDCDLRFRLNIQF